MNARKTSAQFTQAVSYVTFGVAASVYKDVGQTGHSGPVRDGNPTDWSMAAIADTLAHNADQARHVEHIPGRVGLAAPWPVWASPELIERLEANGITAPWQHQRDLADVAWSGQHAIIATGTASGKTLGFWLPSISHLLTDERATALYLAPTKALAHDQLRALNELQLPGIYAATYDGDTPGDERRWVRNNARFILSNPDLVHRSMLPRHTSWSRFLRGLRVIVVDEAHHYRGVFGSHVALVLRRLRRMAAHYGSQPVVVLASATVNEPGAAASRLIGAPVSVIDHDTGPRASLTAVLWQPLDAGQGPRSALVETAALLADLTAAGTRTLAFLRSRRGAETAAVMARDLLMEAAPLEPELTSTIAAYRGGYLAEERRGLERDLRSGKLRAVATTNALELGVDIAGMDAVVVSGWPGTRASLWQQWGRAGRSHDAALGVFVAREDPLDQFVLSNPSAVFGQPMESIVLDPANPFVLGPHLTAAAAEKPLTPDDAQEWFGQGAIGQLDDLAAAGALRKRSSGWYWTKRDDPTADIDLRGGSGSVVPLVESDTGRLLGTIDAGRALTQAHVGAIYMHQGSTYVVETLDLAEPIALVAQREVDYATTAKQNSDYRILTTDEQVVWGTATLSRGDVEVTSQVTGYLKRRYATGEVIGEEPLELPEQVLRTRAVWWTVTDEQLLAADIDRVLDVAGAAHAAEHAAIGLLPLFASCDRWDIGGVSTPRHPDTDACTVMVYDGHPGGAGFADRGFAAAVDWLSATRKAIAECPCQVGCPSCIQSPKCGNGNEPLDKAAAVRLLGVLLADAPASRVLPERSVAPGEDSTPATKPGD